MNTLTHRNGLDTSTILDLICNIRRAIDGVHWTVESYGAGELLSWAHSGLRRPQTGPSHEGVYAVNFSFTITIAGLPSGVTCPQP